MTNRDIIQEEINLRGGCFNGLYVSDFKTYAVWNNLGYKVKRGEKAFMQVDLWIPYKKKEKWENEEEMNADETDGFRKKKSSLFHISQVEKIEK